MNSKDKGNRGEREFASLLRENGFDARRGQQFSGSPDSPDVVSDALAWLHIEVKRVQNLNLTDACGQAAGDSSGKPWVVAHRRNHAPWLITMRAEFFFELIREFDPQAISGHLTPALSPKGGEGCEPHRPKRLDSLAPAHSALNGTSPDGKFFLSLPKQQKSGSHDATPGNQQNNNQPTESKIL